MGKSLRGNDAVQHDTCPCGRSKLITEYVCSRCYDRHQKALNEYAKPFRIVAPPRYDVMRLRRMPANGDLCSVCDHIEECRSCIASGDLVGCESAAATDAGRPRGAYLWSHA